MQLSEIKNDLAKILYKTSEINLLLADFLLIEDDNQSLVSQIINIEADENNPLMNYVLVKFVLSIDKNLTLSTYNGYTPSKNAKILYIDPNEISQLLKTDKNNMSWGEIASHEDCKVILSTNFLKNKPYVQCDKNQNLNTISKTILKGLKENKQKVVVLDFNKDYKQFDGTKIVVGKDFKLPLNYEILDFIYQNDLKDCPVEQRGYVQDILIDIQNYVKSMKDGFIPFSIFKQVVDEQYSKNPDSVGLILLRNKLIKYSDEGILAQGKNDYTKLNDIIKSNQSVLIDAFNVNENWQKILVDFLAKQIDQETYFIMNFTEENANKKNILNIYNNEQLKPIAISSYSYKQANFLKSQARNMVLFTPMVVTEDFAGYNSFLHRLNEDEYVIWGQDTLYIPLILKPASVKINQIPKESNEQIKQDVDDFLMTRISEEPKQKGFQPELEEDIEYLKFDEESLDEENPEIETEEYEEENSELEELTVETDEEIDEEADIEELLAEEIEEATFEEFVEADIDATVETDLSELEKFIPTQEQQENEPISLHIAQAPALNQDFNDNKEPVPQKPFIPIPIYQAEVAASGASVTHKFKEGDFVTHVKYGRGIVEKNISYGNKSLCSIQFEDVGRRLLDPELAELKSAEY